MPVSVIDIPVDDGQFKAFLALFEKYQAQVGKLPGAWKESEKAIDRVSETLAEITPMVEAAGEAWSVADKMVDRVGNGLKDMTAAMLAQQTILAKERQDREDILRQERKAAQEKSSADRRESKATGDRKKASSQMVKDAKEVASSVASATLSVAKWAALGGLSGLVLSGFGLGTLANSIGGARRSASGLGITSAEQQSLNLNYGRYADVNGGLNNIADAQNDPGRQWAFAVNGINPAGKNPADIYGEAFDKARSTFKHDLAVNPATASTMAGAQGLTEGGLGFSLSDLRRMAQMTDGEVAAMKRKTEQDRQSLAISDEVQKKWQEFSAQLARLGLRIENTIAPAFEKLLGPLTKMTDAFADGLKAFLMAPDFQDKVDQFGKGLGEVADRMTNFVRSGGLQELASGVALVAGEIMAVAEQLKWLIPNSAKDEAIQKGYATKGATPQQLASGAAKARGEADKAAADLAIEQKKFGDEDASHPHGLLAMITDPKWRARQEAQKAHVANEQQYIKSLRAQADLLEKAAAEKDYFSGLGGSFGGGGSSGSSGSGAGGVGANNPMNVRNANGVGFRNFGSVDEALRNTANQIQRYQYSNKFGHQDTIRGIISTYAPPKENDTEAYIRDVVAKTGISDGAHVDTHDTHFLAQLMAAMAKHEDKRNNFSAGQIELVISNPAGAVVTTKANQLPK